MDSPAVNLLAGETVSLSNITMASTGYPDTCAQVNISSIRGSFVYFDYPHANTTVSSNLTNTQVLKILVTSIVVLVALLGNMGIVIAVAFNRSLRTTINYYLVNLALADLLICTCCMSVDLINNLTEPLFILGPIVCKMNAFCQSEYSRPLFLS